MNWWLTLLWSFFGPWAKRQAVNEVKRRGVAAYLRVLQGSRRLIIVLLFAFVILQLMTLSLVGAVVTGVLLLDYEFQAKIEILFWIFAGTFTLPFVILLIALSERVWFKVSGASQMVDDLRKSA